MNTSEANASIDKGSECFYKPGDRAPSSSEVLQLISDIGAGAYVYMMIPVILLILMAIIYIEEAIYIMRRTSHWRRTQLTLWILSGFPVICGFCVVALFFPRSTSTVQTLISFYNALCMEKYSNLILHYYGGKKKMAETTNEISVLPYTFPCFMWVCFPKIVMNVRNINIMQYLIYPVTVYQPVVFFILTVLWNEDFQGTPVESLISILTFSVPLASFVAVYGFVIMNKASEGPLRDFQIRGKFIAVQLILGFNTVQGILMLLLDGLQAVPCGFPYDNPRPGYMIHLYVFSLELFLMSFMARFYFRRDERGLQPIPEPRDDFNEIKVDKGGEIDAVPYHSNRLGVHDRDSDYRSESDSITSITIIKAGRSCSDTSTFPVRLYSRSSFGEDIFGSRCYPSTTV